MRRWRWVPKCCATFVPKHVAFKTLVYPARLHRQSSPRAIDVSRGCCCHCWGRGAIADKVKKHPRPFAAITNASPRVLDIRRRSGPGVPAGVRRRRVCKDTRLQAEYSTPVASGGARQWGSPRGQQCLMVCRTPPALLVPRSWASAHAVVKAASAVEPRAMLMGQVHGQQVPHGHRPDHCCRILLAGSTTLRQAVGAWVRLRPRLVGGWRQSRHRLLKTIVCRPCCCVAAAASWEVLTIAALLSSPQQRASHWPGYSPCFKKSTGKIGFRLRQPKRAAPSWSSPATLDLRAASAA